MKYQQLCEAGFISGRGTTVVDKSMKTTTVTTIELTEKEEQIINLGLGALAGLFETVNDNNPFHVKITVDEIDKLEEKLLRLMEEKAALVAGKQLGTKIAMSGYHQKWRYEEVAICLQMKKVIITGSGW